MLSGIDFLPEESCTSQYAQHFRRQRRSFGAGRWSRVPLRERSFSLSDACALWCVLRQNEAVVQGFGVMSLGVRRTGLL